MPTEPRQVPVGPQPDAAARRLHIHGIKEMPAGYDAEVAELFRDLRSATALTEMDLATRLGTRPDVVQALEQGALYALPPWAETCRVVNAYGALLNLDVRPLLRRIYAQLEAGIVELQPKAMPDMPVMTPPGERRFRLRLRQFQRGGAAKSTRHSLAAAGHAATSAASASAASALAECGRPASRRAASAAAECRPSASAAKCLAATAHKAATASGPPARRPSSRPAGHAAARRRPPRRLSRARPKASRLSPNRRRRGPRRRSPSSSRSLSPSSRRRQPDRRSMRTLASPTRRCPNPSPSAAGRRC